MRRYLVLPGMLGLLIGVAVAASGPPDGRAQEAPRLPDEAVRIIEALRDGHAVNEGIALTEPTGVIDQGAPAFVIPHTLERLEGLHDSADGRALLHLEAALTALREAWSAINTVSRVREFGGDLDHLSDTLAALRRAVMALDRAAASGSDPAVGDLQASLAALAGRMASDVVDVARAAGVQPRRLWPVEQLLAQGRRAEDAGRYTAATTVFGNALKLGGGLIDFDIDAFEQNILDTLEGETIGYTYAITLFGTLYASDGIGEARIPPDPNPESQDPRKEMQVASVSKPLTAIIVLWLLEQNGLTPDDPVGPWLPPDWERGEGIDEQTFRDYLTHRTGYGQKGVDQFLDTTYAELANAISIDVPANTAYHYNNSNFAIFRVIIPRLAGFDLEAYPEYTDDELTAGLFVYTALNFYEAVDVHATCNPSQPNPTIYYGVPHNGFNGLQLGDMSLECGAYGFFLSSEDLAAILSDLAVDDELLSEESFQLMKEGFLGFKDPADGWFWGNGGLGIYHNHSGLWQAGEKGLASCIMLFPNGVTASLQINSLGGDYPNQCEVLRAAFDGAWVPN